MRMFKRVMTGIGAVTLAAAAWTTFGAAGPAAAGTCGQTFQPRVNGGEAAWNLYCSGGRITISGWVKDTKADGKCAYVKAFGDGQQLLPHPKACPKDTKTNFSWTVNGSTIDAYLYVA
jgi:hypothetical protein